MCGANKCELTPTEYFFTSTLDLAEAAPTTSELASTVVQMDAANMRFIIKKPPIVVIPVTIAP